MVNSEEQSNKYQNVNISIVDVDENVVMSFNKPVEYVILEPNKAIDIGNALKKKARKVNGRKRDTKQ